MREGGERPEGSVIIRGEMIEARAGALMRRGGYRCEGRIYRGWLAAGADCLHLGGVLNGPWRQVAQVILGDRK